MIKNSRLSVFFSSKQSEEIEYMPDTRQLFKETKVIFEIERKLRGRVVRTSIAEHVEKKNTGSINTKVCPSRDINALIALATNDLRKEQRNHASDVEITGPDKNRMVEKNAENLVSILLVLN